MIAYPLERVSSSASGATATTISTASASSTASTSSLVAATVSSRSDSYDFDALCDPSEELPPYSPPLGAPVRPRSARARNLLAALECLHLPRSPKQSALSHHLVLFNALVNKLDAEGVHLTPLERGWALVTSCPNLPLLDVWFSICNGTPEVGEEHWAELLAAFVEAHQRPRFRLSEAGRLHSSGGCQRRPEQQRSGSWRGLLWF